MIQMTQSEFYRIRKSRLFFGCLVLAVFFVFALALTFRYNTVTVPLKNGEQPTISLVAFTEFLFSDYSLVFPLTLFLCLYFTEDFHKGTYALLLSKGNTRNNIFLGKLFAAWLGTCVYLLVCFGLSYIFILMMCTGLPNITYSVSTMGLFLILQCLCFGGYVAVLNLLSCLLRHRVIVTVVAFFLLGALYLYLTKISTALDLDDLLYSYWIVGLSHNMQINNYTEHFVPIIATITVYLLCPTGFAFYLFQKIDLRRLERR